MLLIVQWLLPSMPKASSGRDRMTSKGLREGMMVGCSKDEASGVPVVLCSCLDAVLSWFFSADW